MTKFLVALMIVFDCLSPGLAQARNQATAQEKREFLQLILQDVREEIREFEVGANDVAQAMSIEKRDLDGDDQPEYLVVLEEDHLCGALGNCPHWVYRKTGNEYEPLLRTRGRELLLEKTSTHGYRDLRSEAGDTASEGEFIIYKYDGNKYQAKQCYLRKYTGKRDRIIRIKCEETDEERR
jgi:hypothetical protein